MGRASTDNRLAARMAAVTAAAAIVFAPRTPRGFAAETERVAEAFNWTVVFLMAMPYATMACCVGWIIYRYTRAHRAREGRQARLHIVRKGEC